MIEINLLPEELRKKETKRIKMPNIPTFRYFVITLIGLFFVEGIILFLNIQKKTEYSQLEKNYEEIKPDLKNIEGLKAATQVTQSRLRQIRKMTEREFYWTHILNAISDEMTEGLWLKQIAIKEVKGPALTKKERAQKKSKEKEQGSSESESRWSLIIRGMSDSDEGGAVNVAKFMQRLEENEVFSQPFDQILLDRVGRSDQEDRQLFHFTITCIFDAKAGNRIGAE